MKTVSLVLGGGGARGLAHIGAIRAIEEHGLKIESVSGTSIGAIVGGLYAAGQLDAYEAWVCSLDRLAMVRLLDPSLFANGIIKGEKIFERLGAFVGDRTIESLPVTFSAVATDITHMKEYWFKQGPLLEAMRASMAIPNLFTPVRVRGRTFVDGGVTNPVPVTPTLSDATDLTLAIHLSGAAESDPLPEDAEPPHPFADMVREYFAQAEPAANGAAALADRLRNYLFGSERTPREEEQLNHLDIFQNSLDVMQESISRFKLASTPPDVLIEIPRNLCNILDFHKARELIDFGYERTKTRLESERVGVSAEL